MSQDHPIDPEIRELDSEQWPCLNFGLPHGAAALSSAAFFISPKIQAALSALVASSPAKSLVSDDFELALKTPIFYDCVSRHNLGGVSSSGKTTDFDSVIRRFESSHPIQFSLPGNPINT